MVALGTPGELKQRSMKGELLLVEGSPLGRAVELAQQAPGVLDAAVFGNALHLVVQEAATVIPTLRAYLGQRGVTVSRIEAIAPTLEDVFVSLTAGRKEQA